MGSGIDDLGAREAGSEEAGAVLDVLDATDQLRVLGRFTLRIDGAAVALPLQAQRVLGYLAVVTPVQSRPVLAGCLWGEKTQDRAMITLRNTLWRLRKASGTLVTTSRDCVSLSSCVWTDVGYARQCTSAIESGTTVGRENELIDLLDADLLIGWDEDWLQIERERMRQLRIHALEALAQSLVAQRRYPNAIQAALAAVRAEPLRESAQLVLIRAHLCEGNVSEAVRAFEIYRKLLADELGLRPSARLDALLERYVPRKPAAEHA